MDQKKDYKSRNRKWQVYVILFGIIAVIVVSGYWFFGPYVHKATTTALIISAFGNINQTNQTSILLFANNSIQALPLTRAGIYGLQQLSANNFYVPSSGGGSSGGGGISSEQDPFWTGNYSNFSDIYGYALNSSLWTLNFSNFSNIYDYVNNGTFYKDNTHNYYNVTNAPIYLNDTFAGNYSNFTTTYNYATNSTGNVTTEMDRLWTANYSDYLNLKTNFSSYMSNSTFTTNSSLAGYITNYGYVTNSSGLLANWTQVINNSNNLYAGNVFSQGGNLSLAYQYITNGSGLINNTVLYASVIYSQGANLSQGQQYATNGTFASNTTGLVANWTLTINNSNNLYITNLFANSKNVATGYDYALNSSLWTLNYSDYLTIRAYALNGTNTWTGNWSNFSTAWYYATNSTGNWNNNSVTAYATTFYSGIGNLSIGSQYATNGSFIANNSATFYANTLFSGNQNVSIPTQYMINGSLIPNNSATYYATTIWSSGQNLTTGYQYSTNGTYAKLSVANTFGAVNETFDTSTFFIDANTHFAGFNTTKPTNTLLIFGDLNISNGGHIMIKNNGTAPTIGGNCTSATIIGSDTAGTITEGAAGGTYCAIIFTKAFVNNPVCFVTANTSVAIGFKAINTTYGNFTQASGRNIFSYHCLDGVA